MLAAFQDYSSCYAVGLKQVFLLVKKLTGGPKEARTLNFQLAKLALSLLSYRPIVRLSVVYTGTVTANQPVFLPPTEPRLFTSDSWTCDVLS